MDKIQITKIALQPNVRVSKNWNILKSLIAAKKNSHALYLIGYMYLSLGISRSNTIEINGFKNYRIIQI